MIDIEKIVDDELNLLLQRFEETMSYVSNLEYPIKLNSFGYFLRLALNTLQNEEFDYVLTRLNNNKELERNEGGYSIEYLGVNNPKLTLTGLINHLKINLPKTNKLISYSTTYCSNSIIVVDRNDYDFLKSYIRTNKIQFLTNQELKKKLKNEDLRNKTLIFYSFNGFKDFDFIYHLPNDVILTLYEQEVRLYEKQLQAHKSKLEQEIISENRFVLCGIKYDTIIDQIVEVNPTLEDIITRLEDRSKIAYEGYKNESDSILDELEEQIHHKLTFSNGIIAEMESNETAFDTTGNLVKVYKLRHGDKIRIYPKEQLAENLLQIAIEYEPEIFGKVEEHAKLWLNTLKDLDKEYPVREELYSKLKEKGLRVLPLTVDAYFRGYRKYPMFNCDLNAIISLSGNIDLIEQIPHILKSKRLYNSTMIAFGRGIKQELKQFLKEKTLGDILNKRNFTRETLSKFIEEQMPLLTISEIQEINHE
ncbi:MAG: hypothetical protein NTX61_16865 [Bacteroidetes bacterium]|nr:hypothetical protein [Bacteroidota bacterium]